MKKMPRGWHPDTLGFNYANRINIGLSLKWETICKSTLLSLGKRITTNNSPLQRTLDFIYLEP